MLGVVESAREHDVELVHCALPVVVGASSLAGSGGAAQLAAAEASRAVYQAELSKAGYGQVTTEIVPAPEFYFAEDYHQQYLAKVPNGYCPVHATGVKLTEPVEQMEQV